LTNDDGIHAPGLWAAAGALRRAGDVYVVAPDREQSGVGACLTLHAPVKAREAPAAHFLEDAPGNAHQVKAYSVEGTPGDSCILALENLVGAVDLVVSGINTGSNLGWDIMVSGTVGAAVQGYVRGYCTIAISVGSIQNPHFGGAARFLELMACQLAETRPDSPFFLNVNVPSVPLEQVAGVQVTRLGGRSYGESVREEGIGPQKKYWLSRNRPIHGDNPEGTDIWALKSNRISITPLQLDLSNRPQIPEIEALLGDIPGQLLSPQN
jgi:5'-nucleotidase